MTEDTIFPLDDPSIEYEPNKSCLEVEDCADCPFEDYCFTN